LARLYLGLCFVPFCDIKSLFERLGGSSAHDGRSWGRSQKSWNWYLLFLCLIRFA